MLPRSLGILVGFWLRGSLRQSGKGATGAAQRGVEAKLTTRAKGWKRHRLSPLHGRGLSRWPLNGKSALTQMTAERDGLRGGLQAKPESRARLQRASASWRRNCRNERQNLAEKLALLERRSRHWQTSSRLWPARFWRRKSKSFSEGSQKELGTLLTPLRTQIKEFREKVEEAQTDFVQDRRHQAGDADRDAGRLESAVDRRSAQSDHGAARLVEGAGRLGRVDCAQPAGEGRAARGRTVPRAGDLTLRVTATRAQRKSRPDVIVNLPGGRHLVIDSKVSLNAYTDSVNAATDEERKAAVRRHLASVRGHVDELAQRRYHKLNALETPDFVVMFVPDRAGVSGGAARGRRTCGATRMRREVLLVGPTTLLFVIRIVDNLWQQELQARSVQEVMDRGARSYTTSLSVL